MCGGEAAISSGRIREKSGEEGGKKKGLLQSFGEAMAGKLGSAVILFIGALFVGFGMLVWMLGLEEYYGLLMGGVEGAEMGGKAACARAVYWMVVTIFGIFVCSLVGLVPFLTNSVKVGITGITDFGKYMKDLVAKGVGKLKRVVGMLVRGLMKVTLGISILFSVISLVANIGFDRRITNRGNWIYLEDHTGSTFYRVEFGILAGFPLITIGVKSAFVWYRMMTFFSELSLAVMMFVTCIGTASLVVSTNSFGHYTTFIMLITSPSLCPAPINRHVASLIKTGSSTCFSSPRTRRTITSERGQGPRWRSATER